MTQKLLVLNSYPGLLFRRLAAFAIDIVIAAFSTLGMSFIYIYFFKEYGDLWVPTFLNKVFNCAFALSLIFEGQRRQTLGKKVFGLVLSSNHNNILLLFLRNLLKYLPWILVSMGSILPMFGVMGITQNGEFYFTYFNADNLIPWTMNLPLVISGFMLGALYILSIGLQGKSIYDRISKIDVVLKNELLPESVAVEAAIK